MAVESVFDCGGDVGTDGEPVVGGVVAGEPTGNLLLDLVAAAVSRWRRLRVLVCSCARLSGQVSPLTIRVPRKQSKDGRASAR